MKQKVALLTFTLRLAGTPKHLAEMVPELIDRGMEVDLLTTSGYEHYYYLLQEKQVKIRVLKRPVLDLLRYFLRERPQVVHTFLFADSLYEVLFAKLIGAHVIRSNRNAGHWRRNQWLQNLRIAIRRRLVDHFIVNSDLAKKYLLTGEGVPEEKITVIPNGIEDKHDKWPYTSREHIGVAEDDFVLVAVERLQKHKKTEYLINGLKELVQAGRKVKLVIVGYGTRKAQLQQLAKDNGVADHCIFVGYNIYPHSFMRISDVFVSASCSEGMSNSMLEAVMMGLPCVISNQNNAGAVVDGQNGFFFDPTDEQSHKGFTEAITRLYEDRELLDQFRTASRQMYLRHYTLKKQVDIYEQFYQSEISCSPPSSEIGSSIV
ncbi:MAG: glycosyltransferase family 4 protein [Bacteroidota bacterium]